MKIATKFPALITGARMPRSADTRTVMGLWDTFVEIEELSARDAPTVLRVKAAREDKPKEYRFRDDRFYRSLGPWRPEGDGSSYPHCLSLYEIWKCFHEQAILAPDPADVHPKGVVATILKGQDISSYYRKLESIGRRTVLSADGGQELERALATFNEYMSKLVVIDGNYWIECAEPMLAVDHFAGYSTDVVTNDLENRDIVTGRYRNAPLGQYVYTINRFEAAYAPKCNAPGFRGRTDIEVLDPSVFSAEVPIGYIISRLEDLICQRTLSEAVRGRLAAYVADETLWSWETAYDELEYCVRSSFPLKTDFMRELLELELEIMEARTIDFAAVLSSPSSPSA